MKRLFIPILLLFLIFNSGCKKDSADRNYVVQGRILECSSNPVPVNNYKLLITQVSYQGGAYSPPKEFQTDTNGYFSINYQPAKGGLFNALNRADVFIDGIDTNQYAGLNPKWYNITGLVDTNLNTMYLFKKINRLIRKIKFTLALDANDSTTISTTTIDGVYNKTFYGPIAAGTLLIADTINQVRIPGADLESDITVHTDHPLNTTITVQEHYLTYPIYILPTDEMQREILLNYY
ncbi:MAG: hypothetical protein ABI402_19065 [Ferruginibacter sp.]